MSKHLFPTPHPGTPRVPPPPTEPPGDPARHWWALGFLLTANLIVFAAVTMMNVALPRTQQALGLSDGSRAAVVTLYSLAFGAFMLLGGRLADTLGLRRFLTAGLIVFGGASLLGGLAPNTVVLLLSRTVQGVGGAMVAATALALISVMFPTGAARARAFSAVGMAMGLGTAASFALAGALVDGGSWRWVMLINAPVALLAAVGVVFTVPSAPAAVPDTVPGNSDQRSRPALAGAPFVTLGLALLVLGFDRSGALGWSAPPVWLLLTGAVLLLGAFGRTMRHSANPLVPPHLLTDGRRVVALGAVFIGGIGMFAGIYVLTMILQGVLGYSALLTGLAFLPFGLSAVVTSKLLSPAATRLRAEPLLAIGLFAMAAAISTFLWLGPDSTYVTAVLPAMLLLGFGGTIVMTTGANAATLGAGTDSGIASALVYAGQQVGSALGTALLTSLMTSTTRRQLDLLGESGATLAGYSHASAVGATIVGVAAVVVLVLGRLPRHGRLQRPVV